MTEVFQGSYADAYDSLYWDKDYELDCDLMLRVVGDHAATPVHDVLDLGCGTGEHARILAARGYSVTGVDRSASMLEAARAKAVAGSNVEFIQSPVEAIDLGRTFDLAIMPGAVLGYLSADGAAADALTAIRSHLEPGSLFTFDCWYGPAVVAQGPSHRSKTVSTSDGTIVRTAAGTLLPDRDVCEVDYHLERFVGDRLVETFEEQHLMGYFDEPTLADLLRAAGFELLRLSAFPEIDQEPNVDSWHVVGAARAVTSV